MDWTKETALLKAKEYLGLTAWVDSEKYNWGTFFMIGIWDQDSNCQGVMYSGHSWSEAIEMMISDVLSPLPNPMLRMKVTKEKVKVEEDGYL